MSTADKRAALTLLLLPVDCDFQAAEDSFIIGQSIDQSGVADQKLPKSFAAGKKLALNVTPMIGGVFGRTTGIAPGCEASLSYEKVQLSVSNEYVFDTTHKSGSFYYTWPQLTYSATNWLRVGLMAERTRAFQTSLDVQRGFLVGISRTKWESTVYIFNAGFTGPTVVLELGLNF
jgi:hypothetical protein